jgi:hypothetical protein
MISDVYLDAQKAEDILANDTHRAQSLSQKLDQSDSNRMDEIKKMMNDRISNLNYFSNSQQPVSLPNEVNNTTFEKPIDQLQEILKPNTKTESATSNKTASADIINLANNTDLSIATIAGQANRISDKQNQEVFISLR